MAVRGALAILFGILAPTWPGITVVALALLFGAWALLDGVSLLINAFRQGRAHTDWRDWGPIAARVSYCWRRHGGYAAWLGPMTSPLRLGPEREAQEWAVALACSSSSARAGAQPGGQTELQQ
jgi:hypothetical protein